MQSMEILQKLEGVDELGEAKAVCCVSIYREQPGQEVQVVVNAFTMSAVVSVCLTPVWGVADLKFGDRLDYDLFQMVQVCKDYMERLKEDEGETHHYELVLAVAPAGEYEQVVIGRNGFWCLMSENPGEYCDTLRFLFLREQFGAYELTGELVEQMIGEIQKEAE